MERSADRYEDDAAVVRRVLAGDLDAFETIVVRWQGPLVNLAFRYCRDRGMAEEMAQDAFLKLYRALGKWRRESRFSTWMFSIAHNHYRSVLRRTRPPSLSIEEIGGTLAAGNLEREIDADLRDDAVRKAVATLPPRYRDVLVLYYFHEMDLAETARTTKLREGTVKARLFRGRKLLAGKLAALMGSAAGEPSEA